LEKWRKGTRFSADVSTIGNMELKCDLAVASNYKSPAQIARVVSEAWFARNGYCLVCDSESVNRCSPNTKCTDFICPACGQNYELKAFAKRPGQSLVNGAYSTLIGRIMAGTAPTLFLLQRSLFWNVESLSAIHSVFLTPAVIEKRKPLGPGAARAGWIGCNIRLDRIGPDGEIRVIERGKVRPRDQVRLQFRRFMPLATIVPTERGWTTLTLSVVRSLSKARFRLSDLYEREMMFAAAYPQNRNIRPKIRQQLQVLRDLGLILFEGNGVYKTCSQS
jgi:type II restriction enzyme